MSRSAPPTPTLRPRRRGGFSIVEAVFAIALVGGLMVVALDTVGASSVAQLGLERRTVGQMLAFELMSEVMAQEYADPDETTLFGIEASETAATRSKFDDLDDYHLWSESPPQFKDGMVQTDLDGWRRTVIVQRVDPSNYQLVKVADTGIRKVRVEVFYKDNKVISMTALRWGEDSSEEVILVPLPAEL